MKNSKRNLLLVLPAFIVTYIVIEHLQKYFTLLSPKLDLYAARNHQYYLLFIVTAAVALTLQIIYLVLTLANTGKPERISVFLALNFVISIISVNLMITTFNILLFTTLSL